MVVGTCGVIFLSILDIAASVPPAAERLAAAQAWTLDGAMQQLHRSPKDPYLQYVALQLASRANRLGEVSQEVEQLALGSLAERRAGRRGDVDLFSLFTGALAVQESLQLDTMRGERRSAGGRSRQEVVARPNDRAQLERLKQQAEQVGKRHKEVVPIADIKGPTIKSHPWKELLGDRKADVSPLARAVPEDYFYVEFRSVNKLLDATEISDLWGTHLFNQAVREARTQGVGERLKKQLTIETDPLARPFYDLVVEEVALTGSDLFHREGSDLTMIFRLKQPQVFEARMASFVSNARQARADAKFSDGTYRGVAFKHLETPDRDISVYAAAPAPNLHVRSNSKVAFERILDAIQGATADGKSVPRLGDSLEFQYIRTLLPRKAAEEDGLVYLSDPFIRRLMGPQVKLTERRRVLCYNHLRMIGHASMLYRTEFGKAPASLEELVKTKCAPGLYGEGDLACPCGGKYSLSPDGAFGVCSHHGHAQLMTPCCEIPLNQVTGTEADEYKAFLDEYNQYWRTYFDPIALRIQVTPERYRLETVVLPLIDNSIYTALAATLGGKPEPLDALPVPKRNIFSVAVRLDKAALLRQAGMEELLSAEEKEASKSNELAVASSSAVNMRAIGIAMHNYHASFNHLPPHAIYNKDHKKPLLSWRVALLPYLEQDALYREFHLDEPWDSEHNKKLLEKMPAIYRRPGAKADNGFKTPYLLPIGSEAVFTAEPKSMSWREFENDASMTIFLVEADDDKSVPWTKPDDWTFDRKKPRDGLGKNYADGFLVCFADGSVRFLQNTIADAKVVEGLTPNGKKSPAIERSDEIALSMRSGPFDFSPADVERLQLRQFLAKGMGNQASLHVYDAPPTFDFSLPSFLGEMLGSFNGRSRMGDGETLLISFLLSSLNAPVYLAVPVQDAAIVDEFMNKVDALLAGLARKPVERGWLGIDYDFYRLSPSDGARCFALRFGPLKFRLFWERIESGLFIASKPFILDDLRAVSTSSTKAQGTSSPVAHAMVRIRAENWNQVLPDYRLGWAENNREACLNNLGPLSSVARAFPPGQGDADQRGAEVHRLADRLHGLHFFCPEGGRYLFAPDGQECTCSVHGGVMMSRQPDAPNDKGQLGKLLQNFRGMTMALTFLEDGLHAVVTIDRK
jgi:hypothetical protein